MENVRIEQHPRRDFDEFWMVDVSRHLPELYEYATGRSAEDIPGDFIVWLRERLKNNNKWTKFDPNRDSALPWLKAFFWYFRHEYYRDNARPREVLTWDFGKFADAGVQPLDALIAAELRAAIQDCMTKLGKNLRTYLLEFYYEGRSYREIAESVGVSVEIVKQCLKKVREGIRKCLNHKLHLEGE